MGQVTLARAAKDHLRDGGSITVTTGVLAMHPMPGSAAISLVNAGLEGFVRAAALEMPRQAAHQRRRAPAWVKETLVKFAHGPEPTVMAAADCRQGLCRRRRGLAAGEDHRAGETWGVVCSPDELVRA